MNYEEKYKEALERARKCYGEQPLMEGERGMLEGIFPELKESEDERIRKGFIDTIKAIPNHSIEWDIIDKESALSLLDKHRKIFLSLLDKQSEQKLTNKIEPKFKVGDWIVDDVVGQISKIKYGQYYFTDGGAVSIEYGNANYHLWTIKDAKDGDVLALNGKPFIYSSGDYNTHCWIDSRECFRTDSYSFVFEGNYICPANKEQCDLLFQKMKEAGYVWDDKQKKISKT